MGAVLNPPHAEDDWDPWYEDNLVCPVDGSALRRDGQGLRSAQGQLYAMVEGIPVMLRGDVAHTISVAQASLDAAHAGPIARTGSGLYLETLGISARERATALELQQRGVAWDPVVAVMVGATSGNAYRHLIGVAGEYPIPQLRFPTPSPGLLLDVGCNWGRWCVAAGRAGHEVVGIDPQLGAVLAARRVATALGIKARFVVGDARYLPFRSDLFDYVWSYSVLQHFARGDARLALAEMARVATRGGRVRVQMANALGLRNLAYMARFRFRRARAFDVRYWTPGQLATTFAQTIGPVQLEADCYFGLGLQWSDYGRLSPVGRTLLLASEAVRRMARGFRPLARMADSLFCTAQVEKPV